MLTHVYSSLFDSPAQTLVNTVNTVGVMGKGIAKEFKSRYPAMFHEYAQLCKANSLKIGTLHLWKGDTRWVLNFPTKTTWRMPSRIEYVERGLQTFVQNYKPLGITSISFPPLGCGNGNLEWGTVRPLMVSYLRELGIPTYIHDVQVATSFVPEHTEVTSSFEFDKFLDDLGKLIQERNFRFETSESGRPFELKLMPDHALQIRHTGGKREFIPSDEIERAWLALKDGILSIDRYSDEKSRRYKSYLFPLLAGLPYVRSAPMRREDQPSSAKSQGLFFDRDSLMSPREARRQPVEQECLFP